MCAFSANSCPRNHRVSLLLLTLLVGAGGLVGELSLLGFCVSNLGAGGLVELSFLDFCVSNPDLPAPAEHVSTGEPPPFPD